MKFRIVLALFFLSSLSWAQSGRINGFITDEETGEVLMGANVFLLETGQGMATDRNGYYVLDGNFHRCFYCCCQLSRI